MEHFPWWTDAQKKLSEEACKYTDEVLMPLAERWSWKKEYPHLPKNVKEEMVKMGWFGARIPRQYGGRCEDWGWATGACILTEETGRAGEASANLAGCFIAPTAQLLADGTEEQKKTWLPRFARGEIIGSIVMTEVFAGSDVANIQTTAERQGEFYMVNGRKRFQTGAAVADVYMTFVRTSNKPEDVRAHKHLTGLMIEKGMPGFTVEKVNDLMGIDGLYNCYLCFDNVKVPVANRIGAENGGWEVMMHGLNEERCLVGAALLGPTRESLRWAKHHLERRVQFGTLTGEIVTNQFKIAEMLADLTLSRLITYYCAYCVDMGREIPIEGSASKLFASEACMRVAQNAISVMGGNGVTKYYPVERYMRYAKLMEIAGGSNDVLKLLLYRMGLAALAKDLKPPIRAIDPELKVPMPVGKAFKKSTVTGEDDLLKLLAENYRIDPGLHMTLADIKERAEISDEDLAKYLASLEEKGLATVHKDRKGRPSLAAATYPGISKANPKEYYRYIPSWVDEKDMF